MTEAYRGVFGVLARQILQRPWTWAAGLLALAVVAMALASRLQVSSDMLGLLPNSDPSVVALRQLDHEEGGTNLLTLTIDAADQATADAFADDLGQRLADLPTVKYALWKVPPEVVQELAPLQLTPDELRDLRDRLKGAIALGPAALNPFIAQRLYALGPLTAKLKQSGGPISLTDRPNSARIIVRPRGSSHDLPFARQLMNGVDGAIADADPAGHGVTIPWIGGAYRHALEDVEGVSHDIAWTAIPSFLLVSLAIGLAFLDWKPVVIIMVPQVLGSSLTLAFATLTIGSVNMFTSFALAVLVGLGNDYGIVLLSRFREERANGRPTDEAIVVAWSKAGPPAFTAALTAAAGFFSLTVASFKGFQQLGLVIGAGVPLCFMSVVMVAPLLIRLLEPAQRPTVAARMATAASRMPATSYALGMPVLLAGVLLASLGGFALTRIRFDDDLSDLRRKGMSYAELAPEQQALAREGYSQVILSYPDDASLDADWDRIDDAMKAGQLPEISRALSIRSILPADEAVRAGLVSEIAALARDPNARYLPQPIRNALAPLAAQPPDHDFAVAPEDLPESIQGILGAGNDKHRILLLPTGNQWSMRENAALTDQLDALLPGRSIAGEFISMATLYRMVISDAPRIIVAASVLVFLLILFDLRSFKRTALVMTVQLVGMLCAIGMRVMLDIPFNLVNFIGVPICMGTGIQAAIFLSHRLHEEGRGGIQRALFTTGLASTQSAITTLLAFASLMLADSRGIRSLGFGIVAADAVVAFSGFVLLPASYALAYWLTAPAERASPDGDPSLQ